MTDKPEILLDDLFVELRVQAVVPSAAVQARMLADAEMVSAAQGALWQAVLRRSKAGSTDCLNCSAAGPRWVA